MVTPKRLALLLCLLPALAWAQSEDDAVDYAEFVVNTLTSAVHIQEIAHAHEIPGLYAQTLQGLAESASPCALSPDDYFFSRVDGTCNNLHFPMRGAALSLQPRFFPNTYDDGCRHPRTVNAINLPLPAARLVSDTCFLDADDFSPASRFSQIVWGFGQFLAHDLSFVEPFEGLDHCCDFHLPGRDHPDLKADGPCFPMNIDLTDSFFNATNCLPFARSFAVDHFRVREVVNGVTSFIDASNVYGSTVRQTNDLRLFSGGLLKTFRGDEERLPTDETDLTFNMCRRDLLPTSDKCPEAGDGRANEQPGLGSYHTMFVLEHNFIANELAGLNPDWTDERLFQMARKMVIAIMQNIVYKEFLPAVLGERVMTLFNITVQQPYKYTPSVDPSVSVEFSTASFRFGHALINGVNVFAEPLSDTFFVPIVDGTDVGDHLLHQLSTPAHEFNTEFTDQIRELLFKDVSLAGVAPSGVTFDLAARNIHRGRDHGIPTYTSVRDVCLALLRDEFSDAELEPYEDVDPCLYDVNDGVYYKEEDIDLFVGAVFEEPLDNAVLGPTFACLNALQFQKLKYGDRFHYTGSGAEGFGPAELNFIERSTMASILCNVLPDNELVQPNVFLVPTFSTPLITCDEIRQLRDTRTGLAAFGNRYDNFRLQVDPTIPLTSLTRPVV